MDFLRIEACYFTDRVAKINVNQITPERLNRIKINVESLNTIWWFCDFGVFANFKVNDMPPF